MPTALMRTNFRFVRSTRKTFVLRLNSYKRSWDCYCISDRAFSFSVVDFYRLSLSFLSFNGPAKAIKAITIKLLSPCIIFEY